jgi:hypothetical protein
MLKDCELLMRFLIDPMGEKERIGRAHNCKTPLIIINVSLNDYRQKKMDDDNLEMLRVHENEYFNICRNHFEIVKWCGLFYVNLRIVHAIYR